VGIGKNKTLTRQPVKMRRWNFASIGIEGVNIAIAQIIAQNDHYVW
jgi:hypothetical protein